MSIPDNEMEVYTSDTLEDYDDNDTSDTDDIETETDLEDDVDDSDIPTDDDDDQSEDQDEVEDEKKDKKGQEDDDEDEVVYDGKPVKVKKEDRKNLLQMGLNYGRLQSKLSEATQKLQSIESELGYSTDHLLQYARQQKVAQAAQNMAEREGISVELAQQIVDNNFKMQAYERHVKNVELEAQRKADRLEYQNKPYFKDFESEIDSLIKQYPDMSIPVAYKYIVGERIETIMNKTKSNTEKKVISDTQDKLKRGIETSKSKDVEKAKTKLSPTVAVWAKKMNVKM